MSGCEAPTPPDSHDDMISSNDAVPPDVNDEPEQPETQTGWQKTRAAVTQRNHPEMLAELLAKFASIQKCLPKFQESECQKC